MSLAIVWRPSSEPDKQLEVLSVSTFIDTMGEAGFPMPCTLDADDRPILHAMSIIYRRLSLENNIRPPNPFEQLVDLIDRYDSIDLNTAA